MVSPAIASEDARVRCCTVACEKTRLATIVQADQGDQRGRVGRRDVAALGVRDACRHMVPMLIANASEVIALGENATLATTRRPRRSRGQP